MTIRQHLTLLEHPGVHVTSRRRLNLFTLRICRCPPCVQRVACSRTSAYVRRHIRKQRGVDGSQRIPRRPVPRGSFTAQKLLWRCLSDSPSLAPILFHVLVLGVHTRGYPTHACLCSKGATLMPTTVFLTQSVERRPRGRRERKFGLLSGAPSPLRSVSHFLPSPRKTHHLYLYKTRCKRRSEGKPIVVFYTAFSPVVRPAPCTAAPAPLRAAGAALAASAGLVRRRSVLHNGQHGTFARSNHSLMHW